MLHQFLLFEQFNTWKQFFQRKISSGESTTSKIQPLTAQRKAMLTASQSQQGRLFWLSATSTSSSSSNNNKIGKVVVVVLARHHAMIVLTT